MRFKFGILKFQELFFVFEKNILLLAKKLSAKEYQLY